MKIKSIRIASFQPYFREAFKMFGVTQTQLSNDLLCIEDGAGRVGYGEAVLSVAFSRNAPRDHEVVHSLIGTELNALPGTVAELRRRGADYYAITFGLDTAYHDLIGRASVSPLYSLLGGKLTSEVSDYLTVPLCGPQETIRRLKQDKPGREVIQMKLGGDGIAIDEARIDAALGVMTEKQLLLADFNGALSLSDARSVINTFSDKRVIWEEPCTRFEDNEFLAQDTGAPLLADQCVTVSRIPRVCETGLFYGITIKPAKTGSLSAARASRDMCAEAGVRVRIDGPWCGAVGTAAILHLAVGTPPELLIASCDMSDPLALTQEQRGGIHFHENTRISPMDDPGIGFTPVLS